MPNLAAWNKRSPSQTRPANEAGTVVDVNGKPLIEERHGLGVRGATVEQRLGIGEHDFLGVLDKPVMLGMEDMVDCGQADILVGAAVAGDEVSIEQLVVVEAIGRVAAALPRPISISPSARPSGTAL